MSKITVWGNVPGLFSPSVIEGMFAPTFADFEKAQKRTAQGYPVVDVLKLADGSNTLEFALAGFRKTDLDIKIRPEKGEITVSGAVLDEQPSSVTRRIARRPFSKTFVDDDNTLDLTQVVAKFEDGLLTITIPPRPETKPLTVEIL